MKKFTLTTVLIFLILIITLEFISKKIIQNKYKFYITLQDVKFYKYYSNKLNHLRDPLRWKGKDLIYSEYKPKKNSIKKIIIQGDSWVEAIVKSPYNNSKLEKTFKEFFLKNNYHFFIAGISSYSPSLYDAQLRVLKNDFNIKPDILITFFDYSDIGDELCRYKDQVSYTNNELIILPYTEQKLYYLNDQIERINILNTNYPSILKLILITFNKINEIYSSLINPKLYICTDEKILSYLSNELSTDEHNYIDNVINNYLETVLSIDNLQNWVVITHPHRNHFTGIYKFDFNKKIKNIISNSKNPNIKKIVIIDLFETAEKEINKNASNEKDKLDSVFQGGDTFSHLTDSYHAIVLEKIFKELKK